MFKFELGSKVIDKITDFQGTITARAQYLYTKTVYLVEPIAMLEPRWIEEDRLENK